MATLPERITVAQDQIKSATIEYNEWIKRVAAGYKGKPYDYPNTAWHKALTALGTKAEYDELFQAAKDMGPDPDPEPVPEPTPTPGQFGTNLPKRPNIASPGSIYEAANLSELQQKYASVPNGSIIRLTGKIDLISTNGQQFVLNRQPGPAAPITLMGSGPVVNGRILVSRANHHNIYIDDCGMGSPLEGIKITDGSHHIDVDVGLIHDCLGQGILQTDPACYDWQIWNTRFRNCGDTTNLDHGIYIAAARGVTVIANCLIEDSQAYGIQYYPNSQGTIITGCTIRGGRTRGGIVLGTETEVTKDVTIVGCVITGSKTEAIVTWYWKYVIQNGKAYDCIEWNNAISPAFQVGTMQYENCIHADPATAAKGHVKPLRYGLLPPTDIDGKPRVTADAGCFAL